MARTKTLPAFCGLLVLQCLFLQGAAEDTLGFVGIAWNPTQLCVDGPDDPGRNCMKCNEFESKCDECLPRQTYVASINTCVRCWDPLCLSCSARDVKQCFQCKGVVESDPRSFSNPGYPVYKNNTNGACRKCVAQVANVGCLKCGGTGRFCTLCDDGYYMKNGLCTKCSGGDKCQKCNSQGVCTACKQSPFLPTYGLNAAKACVQCANAACLDCNQNYKQCKKCQSGSAGIGTRGFGVNAARGCSQCSDRLCRDCSTDSTKCRDCVSDDDKHFYPYLALRGKCQVGRIPHCLHYYRTGVCKECETGYLRVSNGARCDYLPRCKDPLCFDCRGDVTGCRQCNRRLFWDARGRRCRWCSEHCETCTGPHATQCTSCSVNYGLVGGGCVKCMAQTNDPDNVPWCQQCNGNPRICQICFPPQNYTPNKWGRCVPRV